MMGRVVEERGSWRKGNKVVSDSDALRTLVNRVASSTDKADEQVFDTLNYAVEQGNLRYVEDNGLIRWEWVEFL
jgi:hypothetical protein